MYAPEIDSLWEADLAFVEDVAKENDGVNYLLVVIDVLSKYVWVRPMKNTTARSFLEAFDSILSEGRKPEKLRTNHFNSISKRRAFNFIQQTTNQKRV